MDTKIEDNRYNVKWRVKTVSHQLLMQGHKKYRQLMEKFGSIKCLYPIVVVKGKDNLYCTLYVQTQNACTKKNQTGRQLIKKFCS